MRRLCLVLLLTLAGTFPGAAAAQGQDLGQVQRAAEAFARSQTANLPGRVEVKAAALDPHTRLARCESLQPFLPPGARLGSGSSVGVRCLKPDHWTVYVPVAVKVMAEVVVTRRPVGRNQTLSAEDVHLQSADLTQLPPDVLTDLGRAIGKATTTALPAGYTLREEMLRAPLAVTAGQRVRIVFQGDGFTVSSEGRALGNASVGQPVQVRAASGKLLSGVVQEPGVVRVR
jgi:flagella basal body P-ring formation protein FlgA